MIIQDGSKVNVTELIDCRSLHGVFINAEHSGLMKDKLLANGAAFVITCNQIVFDSASFTFAEHFYARLFAGQSLYDAFKVAEDQHEERGVDHIPGVGPAVVAAISYTNCRTFDTSDCVT